MTHAGVLMGQF